METDDLTKKEVWYYFTHLDDEFLDNSERFKSCWEAIQRMDFNLEDLTEILKRTARFIVPDFQIQNVKEEKLKALNYIQDRLSCWEIPAYEQIADPEVRPSPYVIKEIGEGIHRLTTRAIPERFAIRWQELFFQSLHTRDIDMRFLGGLQALAGIKDKDREGADIRDQNKTRLMELIEAYVDHLEGQHLSDLIYSLNKLNIVPEKELQAKIMARASIVLQNQILAEQDRQPRFKHQRMASRSLSQFVFGSANMVMDWPDDLFETIKTLSLKHINWPNESARTLHGFAMMYARTRDEKYKEFGQRFYEEKLRGIEFSDDELAIQVYDSYLALVGQTPEFLRPAESRKIGGERKLAPYLNEIGIETTDKPLILQGTGHHIDINILTADGKRAVGIEFDGPWHFHIYYDHKNPSKSRRIYNGETLMQIFLAEQDPLDAVIVRVPHSARLVKTEKEADYIRAIVQRAKSDSLGRNNPSGVYVVRAVPGRAILLQATKPVNGGPMRTFEEPV